MCIRDRLWGTSVKGCCPAARAVPDNRVSIMHSARAAEITRLFINLSPPSSDIMMFNYTKISTEYKALFSSSYRFSAPKRGVLFCRYVKVQKHLLFLSHQGFFEISLYFPPAQWYTTRYVRTARNLP